jgi:2-polyprenyl-3-methyl-5-hydroxy-6-metoxy-1,4-benzoquinol methylase
MYLVYDVREYFEKIIPLSNKKILDFGCNHGNFLTKNFNGDYTGLDVIKDIIIENKKKWPEHKWIHYENYNPQYAPNQITKELILPEKYDAILAFSVFTHTSFIEYKNTIEKLKKYLNINGKILTTYISIKNIQAIEKMFENRRDLFYNKEEIILQRMHNANTYSFMIDLKTNEFNDFKNQIDLPKVTSNKYFITLYDDEWLQNMLKGNVIDVTNNFNDIRSAQKCLMIE